MNNNKTAQTSTADGSERGVVHAGGLFGEFDATGIGTDLTLEWDSSDPDLHVRSRETAGAVGRANTEESTASVSDEEDRYRHFHQAGLPDA